jgi:hypothetical protein
MSGADTSRWTSQLVIKVAIAAAAIGCLGPLAFALVRSGTEQASPSRKVATAGQVELNSSPAASNAQPPSAHPAVPPATVGITVPDAVTTSTTLLASVPTTTSTTIAGQSSVSQVVTVVDADDGKTIMLRRGQRLRVVLEGPTWQFAEPSDHEVLTPQGSSTYTPGDNCTPLPGTHCGTVTAEFKAMKTGVSVVNASRAPCVQCADDHPQYKLEVRVRS